MPSHGVSPSRFSLLPSGGGPEKRRQSFKVDKVDSGNLVPPSRDSESIRSNPTSKGVSPN